MFIDLVDDYNQADEKRDTDFPDDNISGYSMSEIESNLLKNVYNLGGLPTQVLGNQPSSGVVNDVANINTYFNYY